MEPVSAVVEVCLACVLKNAVEESAGKANSINSPTSAVRGSIASNQQSSLLQVTVHLDPHRGGLLGLRTHIMRIMQKQKSREPVKISFLSSGMKNSASNALGYKVSPQMQ